MNFRRIPGTDIQARVAADTERAVYHPLEGYLGIIVRVGGGWGTLDGYDWPTQREAAEHLLRRKEAMR